MHLIGGENNMDNENVLVMFAKYPELGKTKTRIGEETTPLFALEFTKACLEDTLLNLNGNSYYDMLVAVDMEEDLEKFRKYINFEHSGKSKQLTKLLVNYKEEGFKNPLPSSDSWNIPLFRLSYVPIKTGLPMAWKPA